MLKIKLLLFSGMISIGLLWTGFGPYPIQAFGHGTGILSNENLPENSDFEASFQDDLRTYLDRAGELDSSRAREEWIQEQIFDIKTYKWRLLKSYLALADFDAKLERVYKKCLALPQQTECEDPLEFEEYLKLQAYRTVNERSERKFTYYYLRLLDLSNSMNPGSRILLGPSRGQLGLLSLADQARLAQESDEILWALDRALKDGLLQLPKALQGSETEQVRYFSVAELVKLRDQAQLSYERLAYLNQVPEGSGDLRPRSLQEQAGVNLEQDLQKLYEAKKEVLLKAALQKGKELQEYGFDSEFSEVLARYQRASLSPKSEFINYTGRSFPENHWALTYDDGPKPSTTNAIIEELVAHGKTATFFWLAEKAARSGNRSSIDRAKKAGMELASHSYTHADLGKSSANLGREIGEAKDVLQSVYGASLKYFRLPYGSGLGSARVKRAITAEGLRHFFWNVDSLDWKDPSPASIVDRIQKQMAVQKRGIILVHDIHSKTVVATRLLMDYFDGEGSHWQVKPLGELVAPEDRPANGDPQSSASN